MDTCKVQDIPTGVAEVQVKYEERGRERDRELKSKEDLRVENL